MTEKTKTADKKPTGLALMREPFPAHQISKLPKPTKAQTDEVRADFKKGIRCDICGLWHHPKVVHLDYVGHAALTDRLLDCDPTWNWEPIATDEHGRPVFDQFGGMWIRLNVCGMTRMGYGDSQGKTGPNAVKEVIGDALRNAAMRFGAALDLWHKGDLHDAVTDDGDAPRTPEQPKQPTGPSKEAIDTSKASLWNAESLDALRAIWTDLPKDVQHVPDVIKAKDGRKAELDITAKTPPADDLEGDGIPDFGGK